MWYMDAYPGVGTCPGHYGMYMYIVHQIECLINIIHVAYVAMKDYIIT